MGELGFNVLTCDTEGCLAIVGMNVRPGFARANALMEHAKRQGWEHDEDQNKDYCVEHKTS